MNALVVCVYRKDGEKDRSIIKFPDVDGCVGRGSRKNIPIKLVVSYKRAVKSTSTKDVSAYLVNTSILFTLRYL